MLGHSRQSGALHINAKQIDGIIFFEAGEITHAEAGELIGDDAFTIIVKRCNSIDNGVYKFIPGAEAITRTVLRSATDLMLDALRQLDETNEDGENEEFAAGGAS